MEPSERELDAAYAGSPPVYAVSADLSSDVSSISIALNTRIVMLVPIWLVPDLEGASSAALSEIEITPSGLGLHWPQLDVDLYLPSLLHGVFQPQGATLDADGASAAA